MGGSVAPPRRPAAYVAGRSLVGRQRVELGTAPDVAAATLKAQRLLQIALGLLWLLDGALQLQPSMFARSFVTEIIAPNAIGQPALVARPVTLAAHLIEPRVALFNAVVVTTQVLIGLGLLYRRTVKAALVASFVWAAGVWWIGEGLGGLLTGSASPLTGAPGPALLYVLAGLIVWPRLTPRFGSVAAAGLLGARGARAVWMALWVGFAGLWLLPANLSAGSVHDAFANAPSGTRWLSRIESSLASAAAGRGTTIAIVAACVSVAIGVAILFDRVIRPSLAASVSIAMIYFIGGQGLGGILTGSGTDPGSGPLLVLIAVSLCPLPSPPRPIRWPLRPGN